MAEPLTPMIGYARVSFTGGRDEIISPDIQQQVGNEWAPRNGYRITRWIIDLDETGRTFDRDVTEAMAAITAGEAAAIGVFNYSRWGRDTRECLNYLKDVADAGGDVISWTEPFDAATAIGIFSRTIAFAVAELQSRQIGEGWQRAHANRTGQRQLPADGRPRFGYVRLGRVPDETQEHRYRSDPDDKAGERYVPDPVTGPVLAAMYERRAAGESLRSLARWLNTDGVRTASGGAWTRDSVRLVLASGFGAGLLHVHDPDCRRKPERRKPCTRRVYVPGAQSPVIGPETWQAYLEREQVGRDTHPRFHDPVHPLSGLLYCGSTGHRLTVTSDTGGLAYRCPRRAEARDCAGAFVRATFAEKKVLAWLSQWAGDIETAAAVSVARDRTVHRAQADMETLAAQEAAIQRRLARLRTRWVEDEQMEPASYEQARDRYLADLEAVRARKAAAAQAGKVNAGAWQPLAVGLIAEWPTFSPARRRQMLGELIARIEVHRTGRGQPPRIEIVPVWEASPHD